MRTRIQPLLGGVLLAGVLPAGVLLASACSQDAPHAAELEGVHAATPTGTQEAPRPASYVAAGARGFPAIRDLAGRTLADGDFSQWGEDDRLHVRIRYEFRDGRQVEESAVFRHTPGIEQASWAWSEVRNEETLRRFEVDFDAGTAVGEKVEEGEVSRWSEEVDVHPGEAFAGFGFSFAIRHHRERLLAGEAVELEAVAFTPDPRVVTVEITYGGLERMEMAGRVLRGERFDIEPQIPWIAALFVDAPVSRIWLTHPPPAEFLRFEGPLLEPEDPVVRIDLLPGEGSGAAEPEAGSRR